jgi:phage terminase large subunit
MKQYKPFEKQKLFREAFRDGKFKFLLYGGGVRSGKSYNQITMLTALCLKYPRTRFAILRKTLTNLKRTSLKTFQKICFDLNFIENTHYKINRQDLVVTFYNGSQLEFIEADISKDPELNKLRGLEIDGALLEECNEMSEDVFNVIIQRIGQWSAEFKTRGFVFLNCNPSQGWVKAKFYDKWVNNELCAPFYYQPALPTDNPHNTSEYLESLKELPEADYKTYVLGDWGAFEETNQLIKEAWLNECTVATYTSQTNNIYLGVDVAREGDDRSVITFFDGVCFYKQLVFSKLDNYALATKVFEIIREFNIPANQVSVDAVGNGGGVVDILKKHGYNVNSFISGASPSKEHAFYSFANLKAECNYYLAELLRKKQIRMIENRDLKHELLNIRYKSDERVFQIEKKAEAKKRMGKSPDLADSMIMCLYPFVKRSNSILL